MDLGITYNTADLPESTGFDTIQAGWYKAQIEESDVKSKEQGKSGLSSKYKILGPTSANRTFFDYINLRNPSADCEAIGRQSLGELLRAVGIPSLSNTDQLLGKTLEIFISRDPAKSDYDKERADKDGFVNKITRYRAINAQPSTGAAPVQSGPIGGPAAAPPWRS